MSIVAQLLLAMPGLSRARRAFLLHLFVLWPCVQGRLNLLNLSRSSPFCERTFRRHFALAVDWGTFNLSVAHHLFPPGRNPRWMLAYDHSFVPKSGKRTTGVGWFYNGVAGRVERGLELGLLALVDVNSNTAFALHAKQTTPGNTSGGDTSVVHLRQCLCSCPPDVKHLAVDGAFARRPFVDGVCEAGLCVVSKLRADANLRTLDTGTQKPRGRRKLYDAQVNWKQLDLARWQCQGELQPGVWLYRAQLFHWSLKRNIIVALLLKKPTLEKPARESRVLLFSTDLSLSAREVVEMYRARFQIEFLFRDAKSGAGLTHCQSRQSETLSTLR